MTAQQIISEIRALPPKERQEVLDFARGLNGDIEVAAPLSGRDLADLSERYAAEKDPAQAALLREEIVAGFYGNR